MLCPLRSEEHCFFQALPSAYPSPDEPACPWRCLRSTALNQPPTNERKFIPKCMNAHVLVYMSCESRESMRDHNGLNLNINIICVIWIVGQLYIFLLLLYCLHLRIYMHMGHLADFFSLSVLLLSVHPLGFSTRSPLPTYHLRAPGEIGWWFSIPEM